MYRAFVAEMVDYRRVFEAAYNCQVLLDRTATVVAASEGYLHAIGRGRDAVVQRSIFDLPPYAGAPAASMRLRDALATLQQAPMPTGVVKLEDAAPDGPALWRQANLSAIPGASGGVEYVIHVLETSFGGNERSESDSERRLRKLVEQTYDAIVLFEPHGGTSYVSPTIERVLGFTEQEFAAMNPFGNIHPDDRARAGEEFARLFAEPGGLLLIHFRVGHRDGSFRKIECSAVNRLHDPDIAAIVTTFRDVTEQAALQDELRRGSERLRLALDAAHAISWDWNVNAGLATYSSDFCAFFGLPAERREEAARNPILAVHPEDAEQVALTWVNCCDTGEPFHAEFRGLPGDGPARHYVSHGQLSRDANGQVVCLVGVTWDVTERWHLLEERRLLEQRMQESQKLESLGVLAGGIAHDFNNLLMVILGNISLVQRELGGTHPTLVHLEQMEEATRRATDLCRQLLAYAGKGRFVLQEASVNKLIDETTHLLQVSISKKAVLRLHLEANVPPVVADVTQIRQVLMNLVMNASDAIGERSGLISIHTGAVRADRAYLDATFLAPDIPAGDYVYLEVSDTGSGMSAETQARIFDPFFTTKFTGRGLGLAAVLGIVRGHKGALKVYSEVGRGSSFRLLLPAAPGATHDLLPRRPHPRPFATKGTILVVDDEASVRKVAGHLLEDLGFRTRLAENGSAAIETYREHARDITCVLMDLTMPGLDGVETLRELRRIDPDVRVLLMSGYNEQEALAGFVGRGIAGFIQKPFTFDELEQCLLSLLS